MMEYEQKGRMKNRHSSHYTYLCIFVYSWVQNSETTLQIWDFLKLKTEGLRIFKYVKQRK